ncbi:heavy metal translocating P-type ATPase [Lentibacillus saliphilus]|uniref:heavy metal translocating P-type ATPase n=1 Tax=Lentibacillus saliphilus TaxID=2737028 RepID=UPI001C30CCD7|nr:heavy metal translocating P-type ATPase [Lentibacillus saliphilus]
MEIGANEQTSLDTPPESTQKGKKLFHNIYVHRELIAALLSGVIILATWSLESYLSESLWVVLHLAAFIIGGYAKAKEGITETIKEKDLNVELLMFLAAIGSAIIGYWTEGAILIFIFSLSGALETYTMNKSNKEISALINLQPEEALLLLPNGEKTVPVSELAIGDLIFVKASERIPADGQIIKGATAIDESAITGESLPVRREMHEDVLAGTVALDGSITVKVTKTSDETLFQKIIQLVQSAQDEKSPSQLFIERFEGLYVKIVLAVVAIMMFLPYFAFGWSLSDSIYRAMILLVVASPCALVASIMPATLSAISNSARQGVLFKGGVHLENLSHVKAIAFDKTGTLTNGKPVVTDASLGSNVNRSEILNIIGAIEKESTHPLAQAITSYATDEADQDLTDVTVEDMTTHSGSGVSAKVHGDIWQIGNTSLVGKAEADAFNAGEAEKLAAQGKTLVFAKRNDTLVALFALKDTVREDTKRAIAKLKQKGVHTIMLTGDNSKTAEVIAQETGIDTYIAECLPEDKVTHVKNLRETYNNVAMVGDGINDAPALATANVGISMGEGTDVALETADVVLMKNDLSKITNAIGLSARMNKVVKQNVYFSLAVILMLIATNFMQIIDLPLGVIGHEGSTILVILNGLRLLKG